MTSELYVFDSNEGAVRGLVGALAGMALTAPIALTVVAEPLWPLLLCLDEVNSVSGGTVAVSYRKAGAGIKSAGGVGDVVYAVLPATAGDGEFEAHLASVLKGRVPAPLVVLDESYSGMYRTGPVWRFLVAPFLVAVVTHTGRWGGTEEHRTLIQSTGDARREWAGPGVNDFGEDVPDQSAVVLLHRGLNELSEMGCIINLKGAGWGYSFEVPAKAAADDQAVERLCRRLCLAGLGATHSGRSIGLVLSIRSRAVDVAKTLHYLQRALESR